MSTSQPPGPDPVPNGSAPQTGQPVPPPPAYPAGPAASQTPPPSWPQQGGPSAPAADNSKRNVVAIVSLVVAVVGLVLACIPATVTFAWPVLIVGFIVASVSLFLRGRGLAFGVGGLAVSVVASLAAVVTTIVALATPTPAPVPAVTPTPTPTATTETPTAEPTPTASTATSAATDGDGTPTNPFALGTLLTTTDWEITVNSVTLNATDQVLAANSLNTAPADGNEYVLINITETYTGSDSAVTADPILIAWVDPSTAETHATSETIQVPPDRFDSSSLTPGVPLTGNVVVEVPSASAADGLIELTSGANSAYVALS